MSDTTGHTAVIVMTTVADQASANLIADALLDRRQAACIQQLDIQSHYRWQGEKRSDPEILLLVKTSVSAQDLAIRTIRELHRYDLPEIATVPLSGGSPEYLDWLVAQTGAGTAG